MGVELVLNGANINFVAFSRYTPLGIDGQVIALFVIVLAAAEAAIALAIVLNFYNNHLTIDVDRGRRAAGLKDHTTMKYRTLPGHRAHAEDAADLCVAVAAGRLRRSRSLAATGHTRRSKAAAYLAVACIFIGFCPSVSAFCVWGNATGWKALAHAEEPAAHAPSTELAKIANQEHVAGGGRPQARSRPHGRSRASRFSGRFYTLAQFGDLMLSLDYYIDSLTLVMFMMVTLIATCIHVFAMGYMSDELTEDYVDHEVHMADGGHLHRPGRYYRFFAYMSLFCFSMLGLVLAGNIFQVFVFWELVGICSYFLIGFYVERRSASTAANKAFIMNRVGDFGFLIGLMVLWTWFGTFQFHGHDVSGQTSSSRDCSRCSAIRTAQLDGQPGQQRCPPARPDETAHADPVHAVGRGRLGCFRRLRRQERQFPLQTWLPDAMEGPTPVSALVHSATMVAAGVYLAGRFYPMFTPEVLLTIAYVGCVTLFIAATIAVVATDIKRVLAYSTISQLGYMMLGIGVGGWGAGLFHLITHAFFKSLMFLASGSVIVGCHHEQDMSRMGGLLRKMPITATDDAGGRDRHFGPGDSRLSLPARRSPSPAITRRTRSSPRLSPSEQSNPVHFLLFFVPLLTAGITAFYMFRLWFFTFAGQPRDRACLRPRQGIALAVMTGPLLVLSVFAIFVAVGGEKGPLYRLLIA